MISSFIKFQSLGNDFVVFDWLGKSSSQIAEYLNNLAWPRTVQALSNRHTGVGADCILVITKQQAVNCAQVYVFNADGSSAEMCLNGVRSIAHYLHAYRSFSEEMVIAIGASRITCLVQDLDLENKTASVTTVVSDYFVKGEDVAVFKEHNIKGWQVKVGNPHFVILEKQSEEWLLERGAQLQNVEMFKQGVNVECLWPESEDAYSMISYERGCGLTLGCGSGITAGVAVLKNGGNLPEDHKISINMPGGAVKAWLNQQGAIVLQGVSHFVFRGSFL